MPESLLREGAAMLGAVLADAAQIETGGIVTTLDVRLDVFPASSPGIQFGGRGQRPELCPVGPAGVRGEPPLRNRIKIHPISEPEQERRLFETLAGQTDATLVIAPESAGLLEQRRRAVDAAGGRCLGCSHEAIALCADKLALAEHLHRHRLPTLETTVFEPERSSAPSFPLPIVVKPRQGAGSQNTFLVTNATDLQRARDAFAAESQAGIWQPYVPGLACSVAAIVRDHRRSIDVFPVAEQQLSHEGRFRYLGGRIPAAVDRDVRHAIETVVRQACETISGLQGYVGFDMILPDESPGSPVIVEINPRLTTAYVGYRALAGQNLVERILEPDRDLPTLTWKPGSVTFRPQHGEYRIQQSTPPEHDPIPES